MMILQSATMTNRNVYSHNVPNQQHKADRDISGIGFLKFVVQFKTNVIALSISEYTLKIQSFNYIYS